MTSSRVEYSPNSLSRNIREVVPLNQPSAIVADNLRVLVSSPSADVRLLHPYWPGVPLALGSWSPIIRLKLCVKETEGLNWWQLFWRFVVWKIFRVRLCYHAHTRILSRMHANCSRSALDMWWILAAPHTRDRHESLPNTVFSRLAAVCGFYYCSRTNILLKECNISVRLHGALAQVRSG